MIPAFLIDSDVLIDVLRQVLTAAIELTKLLRNGRVGVSVVTRMELVIGCRDKNTLALALNLLNNFELIALNEGISDIADGLVTKYHLSHGLKIADALICATALYYALPLLTKNQRDFRYLPGLQLLPYPTAT